MRGHVASPSPSGFDYITPPRSPGEGLGEASGAVYTAGLRNCGQFSIHLGLLALKTKTQNCEASLKDENKYVTQALTRCS